MGIDDPVLLSELLEIRDLRDVVYSFAGMHGVPVSVIEYTSEGPTILATSASLDDDVCAAMGDQMGAVPADGVSDAEPQKILYVVPLVHQGEIIAKVAVGPYCAPAPMAGQAEHHGTATTEVAGRQGALSGRDEKDAAKKAPSLRRSRPVLMTDAQASGVAYHIASVLEVLVHNAYARFVISAMHTEAMKANFAELNAKNERLEKAVEHMQEVDRLKSSFLATMSHELRTPLTSVIGYSEMLIEGLAGDLSDEQRDYMATILNKADQLLQLITGLLDVSMLETGSVEMQYEPIALPDLVESMIATVRPTLHKRRITFCKADVKPPRVVGDREKIREVLRNLLTNAIKFTPEGGHIEVSLAVGPLRPDDVGDRPPSERELGTHLIIADSGIGMSPDEQARIFEPFFQVDSSSTRRYGGPGLGLTLAKRYVEALGGSIWVESTPGSGSAFTVALPAVPDDLRPFLARPDNGVGGGADNPAA
ncbi:MAG: HAMP domain-containing histidine kinase [Proteobacteria bacterium]|nr:HAMP domain-containing histidine kinase [Pseudomonadota bacterium]